MSKSVFGYFKTKKKKKKVPMSIKLEGAEGGKALMAWPLVEALFFAASLMQNGFYALITIKPKKSLRERSDKIS